MTIKDLVTLAGFSMFFIGVMNLEVPSASKYILWGVMLLVLAAFMDEEGSDE